MYVSFTLNLFAMLIKLKTLILFVLLLSAFSCSREDEESIANMSTSSGLEKDPSLAVGSRSSIRIDVYSPNWSHDNVTCPEKTLELHATGGTPPFKWTIQGAKVLWTSGRYASVKTSKASSQYLTFKATDSRGNTGEVRGKVDASRCSTYCDRFPESCLCKPCKCNPNKDCDGGEQV